MIKKLQKKYALSEQGARKGTPIYAPHVGGKGP